MQGLKGSLNMHKRHSVRRIKANKEKFVRNPSATKPGTEFNPESIAEYIRRLNRPASCCVSWINSVGNQFKFRVRRRKL